MRAADLNRVSVGTGPRLVLVHGFTQTLRSWDGLVPHLAARYEVVRVDLPGHGGSAEARLSFEATAAALGDAAGSGVYLGYSMGGRLCLRLALDRPDLVRTLVLVGASPGIVDASARTARRRDDEQLAASIEADGVDHFLEQWLARPLFRTLSREAAAIDARRTNTAEGLASAVRAFSPGVQEPLWDRLATLAAPALLVAGERDERFAGLAGQMAEIIGPTARVALVPGAGHAAHLERPDDFLALVEPFLRHHAAR